MQTIGERIRLIRKYFGYTQQDLARICNIQRANISHYENDKFSPSYSTCRKIEEATGIDSNWILNGGSEFPVQKNADAVSDSIGYAKQLISIPCHETQLSIRELSIIELFRQLTPDDQLLLEGYIRGFAESRHSEKVSSKQYSSTYPTSENKKSTDKTIKLG